MATTPIPQKILARQHEICADYLREVNAMVAGMTALGRVDEPEDIGPVVAFFCTDEARWIAAQRMEASGGTLV